MVENRASDGARVLDEYSDGCVADNQARLIETDEHAHGWMGTSSNRTRHRMAEHCDGTETTVISSIGIVSIRTWHEP